VRDSQADCNASSALARVVGFGSSNLRRKCNIKGSTIPMALSFSSNRVIGDQMKPIKKQILAPSIKTERRRGEERRGGDKRRYNSPCLNERLNNS
jgi:hypothetical protein